MAWVWKGVLIVSAGGPVRPDVLGWHWSARRRACAEGRLLLRPGPDAGPLGHVYGRTTARR